MYGHERTGEETFTFMHGMQVEDREVHDFARSFLLLKSACILLSVHACAWVFGFFGFFSFLSYSLPSVLHERKFALG